MPRIKRRQVLQFLGSTLTSIGISQIEFQNKAIRYAKVLAEVTPRKRALLVGINDYTDPKWVALNGAVNDTLLQKELLIHRFGFEPSSIRILTDQEATRENILQAFEEHLIQWAKPGDVVVFHFSGHGSQVADPDKVFPDGRVSTIVPAKSLLPDGYPNKSGSVEDITGHTLWLLMQALNTENVTFVLDCCHSGGARNGVLTVRARPGDQEALRVTDPSVRLWADKKEQDYQAQLMTRLKLTRAEFAAQRKNGVPKGIMLAAARRDQSAIDAAFAGTPAGIFTYVLTRYLWQQTSADPVGQVMGSTVIATQRILQEYFQSSGVIQQPEFNARAGSNGDKQAIYFIIQKNVPAEAVVTKVQGNQVDLFLGGVDPRTLEAFGRGATFTFPDGQGQVRVESRNQFIAKGVLVPCEAKDAIAPGTPSASKVFPCLTKSTQTRGAIAPGTPLQEMSRVIPSDLTLRIGLDASLGQELESARQALKAISKRMEPVSAQQLDVHYILGRVTQEYVQLLRRRDVKKLPAIDSVALFSPAADLVPDSAGSSGEGVADAVANRLKAKLKSLLAARLVKLTLNATSTKLNVAAAIETVDGSAIQAEAFTVRGGSVAPLSRSRGQAARSSNVQGLKPGTEVKFLIQNNEPRELYFTLLLISVDGELAVLSPLPGNGDAPPIPAGKRVQVPDPDRGELYRFKIAGDPGVAEALVIASMTPLKRSIALLQTLAAEPDRGRGIPVNLDKEPDISITNLLQDLDEGNRGNRKADFNTYRLDIQHMVTLSISFEISNSYLT